MLSYVMEVTQEEQIFPWKARRAEAGEVLVNLNRFF
jgi:hypothetical protein